MLDTHSFEEKELGSLFHLNPKKKTQKYLWSLMFKTTQATQKKHDFGVDISCKSRNINKQ
jgi:HJR/Mrr/RecB family endonuclease